MASTSVFAYHYYEAPQYDQVTYFRTRLDDAKRLQVGSMVTEFERPQNNNETSPDVDPFVRTAEACDNHLQSWTMWEYKTFCKETTKTLDSDSQQAAYGSCKTGYGEHLIFDDNGNFNKDPASKLARSYARKVAGKTISMFFNATTGEFNFKYKYFFIFIFG